MSFLGTADLKIEESAGEVRAYLRRETGLLEGILAPLLLAGFMLAGWRQANWLFLAVGAIGSVSLIVNWIQGGETVLCINEAELSIDGNQRNLFSTKLRVAHAEVRKIGWSQGGDGDDGGVYVQVDWVRHWGLPGVDQQDAQAVLDAIRRQFPYLQVEPAIKFTLSDLTPGDGKLITLGLSDNDNDR